MSQRGLASRRSPHHRYWWAYLVLAACFGGVAVGRAVTRDDAWKLFVGVWLFVALLFVVAALVLRRENARLP